MNKPWDWKTITAIVIQTVVIIVWAAKLDAHVWEQDRRVSTLESAQKLYLEDNSAMCQRLARLEEKVAAQLILLERMDRALDKRESDHAK